MKRILISVLMMIAALSLVINSSVSAKQVNFKPGDQAYIDVSVATLWTAPDILRPVDAPSATNPVDMRKWTSSMSLEQQLQLSDDGMLECWKHRRFTEIRPPFWKGKETG